MTRLSNQHMLVLATFPLHPWVSRPRTSRKRAGVDVAEAIAPVAGLLEGGLLFKISLPTNEVTG